MKLLADLTAFLLYISCREKASLFFAKCLTFPRKICIFCKTSAKIHQPRRFASSSSINSMWNSSG